MEHLAEKVHNLGSDTLTIALTNAANPPSSSANAVLADIVTINHTNLSSRVLTGVTSAQVSGTYKLDANDLTLTASGVVPAFRYVVLYNDTPTAPADPLIGFWDYGAEVNLNAGDTFKISFDANGILTLV